MSLAFEINQRYFIKFPGGHPKNRPKIVIIIIFALILSLVIMPEALSITAKCAKCGAETDMNTYPDINVSKSPELKEKVKNGTIFLWSCEHCGQVNLTPFQTLYHDPEEKLMIWLTPSNMSFSERALVESHIKAISAQIEADKSGELLRGYTLRRVNEAGDLIEKVNVHDAGLDDVAIELCKYVTKMEIAEKETDKEKAKQIMDARFKFYKMEGADNDITLTYPLDGQIQGISIGFNVYEDCRGIIKRNPDVVPAPGFAIVDQEWLATKIR